MFLIDRSFEDSFVFKIFNFENIRSHETCVQGRIITYFIVKYKVLNKSDFDQMIIFMMLFHKVFERLLGKQSLHFGCYIPATSSSVSIVFLKLCS